jgi:hypothetical protein
LEKICPVLGRQTNVANGRKSIAEKLKPDSGSRNS